MLENILETRVMGSNTVFLSIPESDYFFNYDSITRKAAEELTDDYFKMRGRDDIPHVRLIEHDEPSHRVKITLDIERNEGAARPGYTVPDTLNITRRDE